jgi:hypothetical protein
MEHMTAAQAPLVLVMIEKLYAEAWSRPKTMRLGIAENEERRRAPEITTGNVHCMLTVYLQEPWNVATFVSDQARV